MSSIKLSSPALGIIQKYLALPFSQKVACPYKNNKKAQIRGGLKVMVGKGSPEEIVEEAGIFAIKEQINLKSLDSVNLSKFLVDHNLGIDCSGFVFYVLAAEVREKTGKSLTKILKFPFSKNPLRKLLIKLRAVQNTNVKILAHEKNSLPVKLPDAKPGDLITLLTTNELGDRDHVMIIHEIDEDKIYYTHSQQWPTDGKYSHGVRQGYIKITNQNKSLLEQNWSEKEALEYAKKSQGAEIRRLNILN